MTSGKPNEEPEMGQLRSGGPHRRPYVWTTLLRGDLDTPPQVSQVSKNKYTVYKYSV